MTASPSGRISPAERDAQLALYRAALEHLSGAQNALRALPGTRRARVLTAQAIKSTEGAERAFFVKLNKEESQ